MRKTTLPEHRARKWVPVFFSPKRCDNKNLERAGNWHFALPALALAMVMLSGSAAAAPDGAPKGTGWTADQNILGHLEQVEDLNQFAELLKLTNLAAILRTAGPFTVFAPTNNAFSYMPAQMLSDLRRPTNKPQLTRILGCHVFPGKIVLLHQHLTAATHGKPLVLTSITGCTVTVRSTDGGLSVEDVNGIKAAVGRSDVGETNGYVNEVDGVLTPKTATSR